MKTLKEIKQKISKRDIKKYISYNETKVFKTRFYKGLDNKACIIVETKQDVKDNEYVYNLSYFDIQSVRYINGFLYSTQFCKIPKAVERYIEYLKNN